MKVQYLLYQVVTLRKKNTVFLFIYTIKFAFEYRIPGIECRHGILYSREKIDDRNATSEEMPFV